jgi:hypothetical protein
MSVTWDAGERESRLAVWFMAGLLIVAVVLAGWWGGHRMGQHRCAHHIGTECQAPR